MNEIFIRAGGAVFNVVQITVNAVAIIDQFRDDNPTRTVTNAAEAVVAHLAENGMLGNKRLLYRDTMRLWDEITHNGQGGFVGFAPLQAKSLKAALDTMKKRPRR
jgi:hypothetical protein